MAAAQAPYLDTKQAAELTDISTVTLERWRGEGVGPPYVKLGRLVKYRRVDLDAFMEARILRSLNGTDCQSFVG
ncbi:helix-turn-helix domain-containing protein [Hyphomonas sp.]|uniref:helix-turn-helix transcriptional regulator n=1 Tax=Hyphomonas sp. TaxID=87 RepID=UPI0025BC8080|nr:helix-turn-helix domain-containing protein [Hyphomonas sp.]